MQAALAPKDLNDLSIRNIQKTKTAAQLYPLHYPTQRSYQMSLGIQREVSGNLVVNADYVRRVFVNTLVGELDQNRYNRFINGVRSPVIPLCTGTQAADPNAECSTGQMTFWTPGGRGVYNALLVRADKRFSRRFQFTASYALTANPDSTRFTTWTTTTSRMARRDARHILSVSGTVNLPWGFELGVISYSQSRSPITAVVPGIDLSGSGISNTPIPGIPVNGLTRGSGQADLSNGRGQLELHLRRQEGSTRGAGSSSRWRGLRRTATSARARSSPRRRSRARSRTPPSRPTTSAASTAACRRSSTRGSPPGMASPAADDRAVATRGRRRPRPRGCGRRGGSGPRGARTRRRGRCRRAVRRRTSRCRPRRPPRRHRAARRSGRVAGARRRAARATPRRRGGARRAARGPRRRRPRPCGR